MNSRIANWFMVLFGIMIVIGSEEAVRRYFPPLTSMDYSIRRQVERTRPTLILIGTSPLRSLLDKDTLTEKLSSLTGKQERILSYTLTSTLADYWYLIIRNQLLRANIDRSSVRVALAFTDNSLTRLTPADSERQVVFMGQQMYRDPSFMYKAYGRIPGMGDEMLAGISMYAHRDSISKALIENIAARSLLLFGITNSPKDIFHRRFGYGGVRNEITVQREARADKKNRIFVPAFTNNFEAQVEKSFLPDIIDLGASLNLFILQLPVAAYNKERIEYVRDLRRYLVGRKVPFVTFYDKQQHYEQKYFLDARHIRREHRKLFSEMLAVKLCEQLMCRPQENTSVPSGDAYLKR